MAIGLTDGCRGYCRDYSECLESRVNTIFCTLDECMRHKSLVWPVWCLDYFAKKDIF